MGWRGPHQNVWLPSPLRMTPLESTIALYEENDIE
jgi:hypothetical protein